MEANLHSVESSNNLRQITDGQNLPTSKGEVPAVGKLGNSTVKQQSASLRPRTLLPERSILPQNYIGTNFLNENEKSAAVKNIKHLSQVKQMRSLQRGISAAVSLDIEQKAKSDISRIEQSPYKTGLAKLEIELSCLEDKKKICSTILNQRREEAKSFADAGSHLQKIQLSEDKINVAYQLKEEALSSFRDKSSGDTDPFIAVELSFVADAIVISALNKDADFFINKATSHLEEALKSVKSVQQETLNNKFSSSRLAPPLQKMLTQKRADFLLAEALSPLIAENAAQQNAISLSGEATELLDAIKFSEGQLTIVRPQDKSELSSNIQDLKSLYLATLTAVKAYKYLADEYSCKTKDTSHWNHSVKELCNAILENESTIDNSFRHMTETEKSIMKSLYELVEMPTTTKDSSIKAYDLHFVSQLDQFTSEEDLYLILGSKGQIKIAPPTSEDFSDTIRKEFTYGINLVRLALFRNFGAQGVKDFDKKFHDAIQADNPITVGDLKQFVNKANEQDATSYYLSSEHAASQLQSEIQIRLEDTATTRSEETPLNPNDEKIIRSEGISFNPFSDDQKFPPQQVNQEEMTREGIKTTKEALKSLLNVDDPITLKTILDDFEQRFVNDKIPLTLGALKAFLAEPHYQKYFTVSSPVKHNIIWHSFTAGISGLRNTQWFLHAGVWPAVLISLTIGTFGDLTGKWRQLEDKAEKK
jgi:hypothetical protein